MKKVLLFTGALLGIGALASCGKQAKNVDLSIKEMDDKFKMPSDLLAVDGNYADFAISSARANLINPTVDAAVPRKTVFEETSNINAAVNSGKLLDYVPDQWGQQISALTKDSSIDIPIDTTDAYKYSYVESLTLFDDLDLTEYTINANRRYVTHDGGELNYKTTEALYNFWPVEETESEGKYSIQNYVKENKSKEDGTFDYKTVAAHDLDLDVAKKMIREGVAETAAEMYMYILDGSPSKTVVPETVLVDDPTIQTAQAALSEQIKYEVNQGMVKTNLYPDQFNYYISRDYNSIYLFQSRLSGSNYVFPSSSSSSANKFISGVPSFNDIIPVYSVTNMVAKISRFDKGLTDWRVDHVGMYGKTYATKDDNLVTFDKPRCISSEYWFTSSTYDKVSGGVLPKVEQTQKYETKDALDEVFNGFAGGIYSYEFDPLNMKTPRYNLNNPIHRVSCLLSDIRGVKQESKVDPDKPISAIAGGFDFSLSDKTMEGSTGLKENQYLFSGIWDPSSAQIQSAIASFIKEEGYSYGKGMVLKALKKDQTSITIEEFKKPGNEFMYPSKELTVHNLKPSTDSLLVGGVDSSSSVTSTFFNIASGKGITDGSFNIDIVIELTENNDIDIVSVTLEEIETTKTLEEISKKE